MAKFKIDLNNINKIRDVLQLSYQLADEQIAQAQNEINKLSYATNLNEETIEGKAKYAKAINDYMGMKDKAISKKIEIAKLMTEIYKHNGDVGAAMEEQSVKSMSFNFDEIKKMVDESYNGENSEPKTKTIEF